MGQYSQGVGTLNISNANDKNLHQILHLNLHLASTKPALEVVAESGDLQYCGLEVQERLASTIGLDLETHRKPAIRQNQFAAKYQFNRLHKEGTMLGNYATVRRYEGVVNPAEAARRVQEGFVPLISKIRGFVAYYWVDAGGGVMISTSIFQDLAGEEESNRLAKDWVRENNMAAFMPNPPQVSAGKVVAHD